MLAREVTALFTARQGLLLLSEYPDSLFSGAIEALSESDVLQPRQDGLPASALMSGDLPETLTQLLVDAGMAPSSQVKDALWTRSMINNRPVGWAQNTDVAACLDVSGALFGRFFLVRLGKKPYHLFEIG